MDNFLRSFRRSLTKIHGLDLKGIATSKNALVGAILILAVIFLASINRLISTVSKKPLDKNISGSKFISESKESMDYFKRSCGVPELLNKKALKYVNTQQFSALRAFSKKGITFESLYSVLKFGLENLENVSLERRRDEKVPSLGCIISSNNIALNPALLDSKQKFDYDLEANAIADIGVGAVKTLATLKESSKQLSIEEKVLYVGLGIIGAYSSFRQTYEYIEALQDDIDPSEEESYMKILDTQDRMLSKYIEAYIELSDRNNLDLEALIEQLGKDALLNRMDLGPAFWGNANNSIVDKTSLLFMLNLSLSFKQTGRKLNSNNSEILKNMILNRVDFSDEDVSHISRLKDKVKDLSARSQDRVINRVPIKVE